MGQVLESPRLRLVPLAETDKALYVSLYSDPGTMRWIAAPRSAEAAARSFRTALAHLAAPHPTRLFWVVRTRDGDAALGLLGLDRSKPGGGEVGALFAPRHQAQGHATESIAALARHAFDDLGLECLHTRHAAGHASADALMRRLGFRPASDVAGPHARRWMLTRDRWLPAPGDKAWPIR